MAGAAGGVGAAAGGCASVGAALGGGAAASAGPGSGVVAGAGAAGAGCCGELEQARRRRRTGTGERSVLTRATLRQSVRRRERSASPHGTARARARARRDEGMRQKRSLRKKRDALQEALTGR